MHIGDQGRKIIDPNAVVADMGSDNIGGERDERFFSGHFYPFFMATSYFC
jgi:hypothetical protein